MELIAYALAVIAFGCSVFGAVIIYAIKQGHSAREED